MTARVTARLRATLLRLSSTAAMTARWGSRLMMRRPRCRGRRPTARWRPPSGPPPPRTTARTRRRHSGKGGGDDEWAGGDDAEQQAADARAKDPSEDLAAIPSEDAEAASEAAKQTPDGESSPAAPAAKEHKDLYHRDAGDEQAEDIDQEMEDERRHRGDEKLSKDDMESMAKMDEMSLLATRKKR